MANDERERLWRLLLASGPLDRNQLLKLLRTEQLVPNTLDYLRALPHTPQSQLLVGKLVESTNSDTLCETLCEILIDLETPPTALLEVVRGSASIGVATRLINEVTRHPDFVDQYRQPIVKYVALLADRYQRTGNGAWLNLSFTLLDSLMARPPSHSNQLMADVYLVQAAVATRSSHEMHRVADYISQMDNASHHSLWFAVSRFHREAFDRLICEGLTVRDMMGAHRCVARDYALVPVPAFAVQWALTQDNVDIESLVALHEAVVDQKLITTRQIKSVGLAVRRHPDVTPGQLRRLQVVYPEWEATISRQLVDHPSVTCDNLRFIIEYGKCSQRTRRRAQQRLEERRDTDPIELVNRLLAD